LWRGGGENWYPLLPFHLALSTSQHQGSQHIHWAVSLSSGRCFDLLIKIRWLFLFMAHLRLFTILWILPKPQGIFLVTLKKKKKKPNKFKVSKNSFKWC
jgi:hypothetical protein